VTVVITLAEGERAGVCTGPGPCDTSVIGEGKNWVTKVGGLPLYHRAIAHALMRDGHSEQDAIKIAVGRVEDWAAGKGDVTTATQRRAQQAVNEWEAKRREAATRSAGRRDMPGAGALSEDSSASLLLPKGPSERQVEQIVATEKRQRDRQAQPHSFRGKDLDHCTVCNRSALDPVHHENPRSAKQDGAGARHSGPIGHSHERTGHALANYTRRRRVSKESFNADCDALEPHLEEQMRTLFERQRDATISRLKGRRGKQALRAAMANEKWVIGFSETQFAHPFERHPQTGHCAICAGAGLDEAKQHPNLAELTGKEEEAGGRAGPANPQGPPSSSPTPAPAVAATLKGVPAAPMSTSFASAAPILASLPPATATAAVALADAIFQVPFWTAQTAAALWIVYRMANQLAIARVDSELRANAGKAFAAKSQEQTTTVATTDAKEEDIIAEQASASAAESNVVSHPQSAIDLLRARAQDEAAFITETTYETIVDQLARGLERGESLGQLVARVQAVFSVSDARAARIARTETIGALNAAANAQAEWLGPEHVARKEWLAHHDDRTRRTHRLADGQVVPIGQPFFVGQSLMQFPGDPTAPASEVCNCRCGLAFLPPGAERISR
jgi:hypothetical protein